ncbi:MAG: hypothetical protein ACRDHF_18560 [Tepidiformaceae bacterium]
MSSETGNHRELIGKQLAKFISILIGSGVGGLVALDWVLDVLPPELAVGAGMIAAAVVAQVWVRLRRRRA